MSKINLKFKAVLAVSCLLFFQHIGSCKDDVLRILNWSEFILAVDDLMEPNVPMRWRSPILAAFMAKYNCKIEYYEYDGIEELFNKLKERPDYYDVVITANGEVTELIKMEQLEKLDYSLLPNSKHIMKRFHSIQGDESGEHFVPYLVGTTGMVYNTKAFPYEVTSWKEIFTPGNSSKGKVNIFDDAYLVFPMIMQFLGRDPNSQNDADIKRSGRTLQALYRSGALGMFSADVARIRDALVSGKIVATPFYSGDALSFIKRYEGLGFKYIIPEEGGEFYIDCVTIPTHSKNKMTAHKFVNYLMDPAVHAENAMYLNYMCPNKTSEKIIREKASWQLSNSIIYPDKKTLDRLEIYNNKHPEIRRWWKKIFKR